jgi:hypothetical protein
MYSATAAPQRKIPRNDANIKHVDFGQCECLDVCVAAVDDQGHTIVVGATLNCPVLTTTTNQCVRSMSMPNTVNTGPLLMSVFGTASTSVLPLERFNQNYNGFDFITHAGNTVRKQGISPKSST